MRRHVSYLHLVTIMFTLTVGILAHRIVDGVGDSVVQTCETIYDLGVAFLQQSEPQLIPPRLHSCGRLIVTVRPDGKLYLGSRESGSLTDLRYLRADLAQIFRIRTENHMYREGIDPTSALPVEQRIERTVHLKAPGLLTYGDLIELIQVLNETGADPILLGLRHRRHADAGYLHR